MFFVNKKSILWSCFSFVRLFLIVFLGFFAACAQQDRLAVNDLSAVPAFDVFAAMQQGPGNVTVAPNGEVLVSLHQFFNHQDRVVKVLPNGDLEPVARAANLNSVLGLQADKNNVLWLLDNAMRGGKNRRLVGWDLSKDNTVTVP